MLEVLSESRVMRGSAWCAVIGLLTWGIAGCGSAPPPPPPTPQEATAVLTSFLDAWKAGGQCEELAARTPPIRGIDPEWAMSAKLLEYTIEDSGNAFGNSYNVRTKLKVQRPGSKQKQNLHVIYTVSTGDPMTVVRE